MARFYKYIMVVTLAVSMACIVAGCGNSQEETTTETVSSDGNVESPEDFSAIGLYIDITDNGDNVTDVSYEISGDIGIVSFRYSGVRAELRGSCKYKEYELAGIENTSTGNMVLTSVQGCDAAYYTLSPGRAVFWTDGTINYSLYVNVTATDEVLKEILGCVVFENRYEDRADVQQQEEEGSRKFARKIVTVFCDKDLETLADMIYYPQETGNGQSMANRDELLALDADELFTDILIEALSDENALDDLRMSEDGEEYIIGTNYKNVHFAVQDDGSFLITEINN